MKLPTPNEVSDTPNQVVEQRECKILSALLANLSDDLVKGNFIKHINQCNTISFDLLIEYDRLTDDGIVYRILPDPSEICKQIKSEFEKNGWAYCFVDWQTFRNNKRIIVKLYPSMPSWIK